MRLWFVIFSFIIIMSLQKALSHIVFLRVHLEDLCWEALP